MKIVIVGAGAMGSVYAALFAEAGQDVWAIDTWAHHIQAIQSRGLFITGASGDRTVGTIQAAANIETAGPADLYIIATKSDGVGAAAKAISKVAPTDALILTIQNGLGAAERIAKYMPTDNVLLGVAEGFGASIPKPGHVHHNAMRQIRIGEVNGGISKRVDGIAKVWRAAGFQTQAFDDIQQLIWEKFLCNVTFSAPCTVFDATIGELMADTEQWHIAIGGMLEGYAIAKAKGIRLSFDDPVAYVTQFGQNMPDARPSMLLDHRAKKRSELAAINGQIPILGRQMGIETPFSDSLVAVVRQREKLF